MLRSDRRSILFMLSREPSDIPDAEARTLVADLDPDAKFEKPEPGLLVAHSSADPSTIESRVAFSRRVGLLVPDADLDEPTVSMLRRGTYRVRVFGEVRDEYEEREIISSVAERVEGKVSLKEPDMEVSAYVSGDTGKTYFALTMPGMMRQGWATRRPRSRAYFHPSAIFPKLSRALVNFSGVQPGEVFVDPFCGTGSLLIEASIVGADSVGVDMAKKMVRGSRRNSIKYGQPWLGIIRADSRSLPVREVSGISTDIPYGRAASAGGLESSELLRCLVAGAQDVLPMGRKLVVMHPKTLKVEPGAFDIERELDIYVHRTLTRTISVMRRTL
ncbi:MAG TPA: hypothetical protein VLY65_02780 [Nitrososphaerales archaeon]|nr:hypothetical protein [Nitrososphaerales archaeon]